MEKLILLIVSIIFLTSCNNEQITTDVKLIATDEFAQDAKLFIDGYFIESFIHADSRNSISPCADGSDNFPSIILDASPTSVGRSFYDFVIISQDYLFQNKGTKILDDGICQKWEVKEAYFKPVVDERFDVQGMVQVSKTDVLIRVTDDDIEKNAVLKIIVNNNELGSNIISSKEPFEQNIELEHGMNFIGIESIVEGNLSNDPVLPNIEIIEGEEIHRFQIQSINDQPGAYLIVCQK